MAATKIALLTLTLTSTAALAQYQPVQASGVAAVAAGNACGTADTTVPATGTLYPATSMGVTIAVAGAAISLF